MRRSPLAALMTAAILFSPAAILSAEGEGVPPLRVLVADDREEIPLNIKGRYRISVAGPSEPVISGNSLYAVVRPEREGLVIGRKTVPYRRVSIATIDGSEIGISGRVFRGEVDIIQKANGKLAAINRIGVEDYLYGVLYHEISHRWPMEALKAQAIASRTFALYQAGQNRSQEYDLRSDIYSQVYGGKASEKWSTTRAVDLTKGKVLVYGGAILPSYFHATCAGHTEDASNLWGIDLPPLKGVACVYCKASRHYRWTKEILLAEIEDRLRATGHEPGRIVSVAVLSKNASGRVSTLEIKDDTGSSITFSGKDFRQIVGPNNVRSIKFEVYVSGVKLVLKGFGWGHGVGMCQWGSYGLAQRGRTAEEILKFYYPGAEVTTIDKIGPK